MVEKEKSRLLYLILFGLFDTLEILHSEHDFPKDVNLLLEYQKTIYSLTITGI